MNIKDILEYKDYIRFELIEEDLFDIYNKVNNSGNLEEAHKLQEAWVIIYELKESHNEK